jgi:hypothetical protein
VWQQNALMRSNGMLTKVAQFSSSSQSAEESDNEIQNKQQKSFKKKLQCYKACNFYLKWAKLDVCVESLGLF